VVECGVKNVKRTSRENEGFAMVKTRHGGGEDNEEDETVDTEVPHCSSRPNDELLGTKESCVNVSACCQVPVS